MSHPGVMAQLERLLGDLKPKSLSVREAADALAGHGATFDQVAQALGALHIAGVLQVHEDGSFEFVPVSWADSLAARVAALDAMCWARSLPDELGECDLLVAAPADASTLVNESYQRLFLDLRTAVRTLVAQARHRVLLAAPYWDVEVASDLADLLRRRQEVGVRIAILARQPHPGSMNERALDLIREELPEASGCQIRILERPAEEDPFGTSTFHFKAACADGTLAYVGSANFNTAGLSSRWELGVRLGGRRARTVSDLVETLFAASRSY